MSDRCLIRTSVWQRRTSQDAICRGILKAFESDTDVDFAYPTYRIYRLGESKPELKGERYVRKSS